MSKIPTEEEMMSGICPLIKKKCIREKCCWYLECEPKTCGIGVIITYCRRKLIDRIKRRKKNERKNKMV